MSTQLPLDVRLARVRAVLAHPDTTSHATVAAATGLARETVRRIRFGLEHAELLPELPRMDPASSGARCWQCAHWQPRGERPAWDLPEPGDKQGRCLLGIPECRSEGMIWARGCGAFSRAR